MKIYLVGLIFCLGFSCSNSGFINLGEKNYSVKITAAPEQGGQILVIPEKDSYKENDRIRLIAKPLATGWVFAGWQGDIISTVPTVEMTVLSDLNIQASFSPLQTYHLNITKSSDIEDPWFDQRFNLIVNPDQLMHNLNSLVSVSIPSLYEDYVFTGWTGDITGTNESFNLVMNKDYDFQAHFSWSDPGECFNDSLATSTNCGSITFSQSGSRSGLTISPPGDVDFYRIYCSDIYSTGKTNYIAQYTFNVELRSSAGLPYNLEILDGNGNVILQVYSMEIIKKTNYSWIDQTAEFYNNSKVFYIKVTGTNSDGYSEASSRPYQLIYSLSHERLL